MIFSNIHRKPQREFIKNFT